MTLVYKEHIKKIMEMNQTFLFHFSQLVEKLYYIFNTYSNIPGMRFNESVMADYVKAHISLNKFMILVKNLNFRTYNFLIQDSENVEKYMKDFKKINDEKIQLDIEFATDILKSFNNFTNKCEEYIKKSLLVLKYKKNI